jgi:hypothetical protein
MNWVPYWYLGTVFPRTLHDTVTFSPGSRSRVRLMVTSIWGAAGYYNSQVNLLRWYRGTRQQTRPETPELIVRCIEGQWQMKRTNTEQMNVPDRSVRPSLFSCGVTWLGLLALASTDPPRAFSYSTVMSILHYSHLSSSGRLGTVSVLVLYWHI